MQDVVTEAQSTFKDKEQLIQAYDYSITLLKGIFMKWPQNLTSTLIHASTTNHLYTEKKCQLQAPDAI